MFLLCSVSVSLLVHVSSATMLSDKVLNTSLCGTDCYFTLKAWNAQTVRAAAVLVAYDRDGPLVTMDTPEDDPSAVYLPNITIPSVLIN